MSRLTRKMANNKYLCERAHFKYRLLQRYGITCNRILYREITQELNSTTLLLIQSLTKEIHEVTIENKQVWVVLDTMRGELVTALEYECELRLETGGDDEHKRQLLDTAYQRHREILSASRDSRESERVDSGIATTSECA